MADSVNTVDEGGAWTQFSADDGAVLLTDSEYARLHALSAVADTEEAAAAARAERAARPPADLLEIR